MARWITNHIRRYFGKIRVAVKLIATDIPALNGAVEVIEDEYLDLYYLANAVDDRLVANEEELSVFVINGYGFCSDTASAIYIRTIEE